MIITKSVDSLSLIEQAETHILLSGTTVITLPSSNSELKQIEVRFVQMKLTNNQSQEDIVTIKLQSGRECELKNTNRVLRTQDANTSTLTIVHLFEMIALEYIIGASEITEVDGDGTLMNNQFIY